MKKLFILAALAMTPLLSQAQFFNFNFGDDFFNYPKIEQRQEEKITKPEFKGGKETLEKYLKEHFKNASGDRETEGMIIVACILNEKGRVEETHIVKGLRNRYYNSEAQRVCKQMKFKPGKRGKKKVRSRYDISFPIRKGRLNFENLNTTDV